MQNVHGVFSMPKTAQKAIPYEILFADEAYLAYVDLPSDRIFERITHNIELLEYSPLLGHVYDPAYEAKQPPVPCRVLYCEQYGIYYSVDDETETIYILAIEDQRRDPKNRFSSFVYAIESFE